MINSRRHFLCDKYVLLTELALFTLLASKQQLSTAFTTTSLKGPRFHHSTSNSREIRFGQLNTHYFAPSCDLLRASFVKYKSAAMPNSDFEFTSSFASLTDQETPSSTSTSMNIPPAMSAERTQSIPSSEEESSLRQSLSPLHQHDHKNVSVSAAFPYLSAEGARQSSVKLFTSEEDEAHDDILWSFWSNTFFVGGGVFYLVATGWDYALYNNNPDFDIDLTMGVSKRALYDVIWLMGPLVYLINSVIDVKWAMKVRKRDQRRRRLEKLLLRERQYQGIEVSVLEEEPSNNLADMSHEQVSLQSEYALAPTSPTRDNVNQSSGSGELLPPSQLQSRSRSKERFLYNKLRFQTVIIHPTKKLFRRMRKHMGHRRELAAAVTFGMAAFFSVGGAVVGMIATNNNVSFTFGRYDTVNVNNEVLQLWASTLENWSIHIYLISAIFALWKNPCSSGTGTGAPSGGAVSNPTLVVSSIASSDISSSWCQRNFVRPFNDVDSLESLGDIFFGIASVVDVILQDTTVDDDILWWPIVSAWLWTLDALLYLRGDFVSLYIRREMMSVEDEYSGSAFEEEGDDVDTSGFDS